MIKRIGAITFILSVIMMTGNEVKGLTTFIYKGNTKVTGERCLLVDESKAGNDTFTFASTAEALRYAEKKNAADTTWTEIYIAPSVYWMDDPDDDVVRRPNKGEGTPYAMEITAERLRLIGMGQRAEDVVLACNRGQTQGAKGNFTMFHFKGSHVEARDITFGNYCNVDLVYETDKTRNRAKRKEAIVQAQIAICDGDYYRLDGCRFISRLNLCPFVGGRHTEFNSCYFECIDDALCGTGIYRQCRFTFFSSKPFYTTDPECGAVFIDCDIHCKTKGIQYLTKVSGPVRMERCRWTSDDPELKIQWSKRADPRHLCVMENCTLNGKPLDVPTPTQPLPIVFPPFQIQTQPEIIPGAWTIDCYKPKNTEAYDWQPDKSRSAWGYAEGVDGAEGSWGLVQLQKGARMMFTPKEDKITTKTQICTIELDPCKSGG